MMDIPQFFIFNFQFSILASPHGPHKGGREAGRFETIPGVMREAVFPEKPAVRPLEGSDYELAQEFSFRAKVDRVWDVVVHLKPGFK